MKSQVFAATLLLAALSAPAHAGLFIAQFDVGTYAHASLDSGYKVIDQIGDREPYRPPFMLLSTAQYGNSHAAALQDKGGFFRDQANVAVTEYFTDAAPGALARSQYHVMVGTDQPDTPLIVNFNFFGASASVLAKYWDGNNASIYAGFEASIRAEGRDSDTGFRLLGSSADVWSILRTVELGKPVTGNTVDDQHIGMPSEHFVSDWVPGTFDYSNELKLDAFSGTLDFGVLQPGKFYAFEYYARAFTEASALPYTGRGNALLVDPFSLEQPPEFQFSIAGLQLPTPPVPEPASALLMLVGLGWLGWRRMR